MPTVVAIHAGRETTLWTDADFLRWLEPGRHADLIDGERFIHSPVSLKHADLLNFLDEFLRRWLRPAFPGGRLYR